MTVRTKGDMCGLTTRLENSYGKINAAGTSEYSGTLLTMTTPDAFETDEIAQCGSRIRGGIFRTGQSHKATATFNMVRGQGWQKWITKANGALTGVQRDLPSFDTVFRVAVGENHLLTGCRVNTLTMASEGLGKPIEFTANMMCRWHTMTPFTDSDGTTSLSLDPVSPPVGVPVTFNKQWEYSTDGGTTWTEVKAKGFSLNINQNLIGDPGLAGRSSNDFSLEAGEDSCPQDCEITLDLTKTSTGPEWDAMRLAFTTGMTFRTTIDGYVVTLTGCNLDPEMPNRTQGTYDETIKVTASDMTVVAV